MSATRGLSIFAIFPLMSKFLIACDQLIIAYLNLYLTLAEVLSSHSQLLTLELQRFLQKLLT